MKLWNLLLVMGAAGQVWAQPAPSPLPAARPPVRLYPVVISNPDWDKVPSSEEIARVYPPEARREGLSGAVDIGCEVTVEGRAINCVIFSEYPSGQGFGDAVLALAPSFRLNPKTANGFPVAGTFRTRINFAPSGNFVGGVPPSYR